MNRGTAMKAGLVLLGAVLVAGFLAVLEKRFAEGGIYPLYASYRSDPLGTSVLYESLERIGQVGVSRNLTHLNSIAGLDGESVLLLLGYPRDGFEDLRAPENSPVMKAVEAGARLVITINPELVPEAFRPGTSDVEDDWIERRRRIREGRTERGESEKEKGKEEKPDDDEETEEEEEARLEKEMESVLGPRLTAKFGFEITNEDAFTRPEEGWETIPGKTVAGVLPAEMPLWRSQYRFEAVAPGWQSAVLVDGKAVVLEQTYGKGTVVLASDTYFVSNEALHFGAEPDFLLWLLGGKTKIVFDETIHGTSETGGAMKLIRRYRAHGVFFGLIVFLVLWAWRSASPLVPGSEELERGLLGGSGAVVGEETGAGLIRLLRRSVSPGTLLGQCVEIWKGSTAAEVPKSAGESIAKILERHRNDPRHFGAAEAYRSIADLLRKR